MVEDSTLPREITSRPEDIQGSLAGLAANPNARATIGLWRSQHSPQAAGVVIIQPGSHRTVSFSSHDYHNNGKASVSGSGVIYGPTLQQIQRLKINTSSNNTLSILFYV